MRLQLDKVDSSCFCSLPIQYCILLSYPLDQGMRIALESRDAAAAHTDISCSILAECKLSHSTLRVDNMCHIRMVGRTLKTSIPSSSWMRDVY